MATKLKTATSTQTANYAGQEIPTGPAAAAILSGSIGIAVFGLMTTGAVLSEGLKNFLNWYNPSGPLVGKAGIGILAWLISWAILHNMWKEKDVALPKVVTWSAVLILVGLALTFPPIFEAFE